MKIAVASGKGGTGKTTVAVNLALVMDDVQFLDCDVEGANAHIFLQPHITTVFDVGVPLPLIDTEKCIGCGKCAEACRFGALVRIKKRIRVQANMCHGCGACHMVCPNGAVTMVSRRVGTVGRGTAGKIAFAMGELDVGEAMGVPIIRALKALEGERKNTVIDCPPGTSCPVVESIRGCDRCIMVTEPTPFGLHDLKLMAKVASNMCIPSGIVINRSRGYYAPLEEFAAEAKIPILLRIPFDRRIAELYSRGENLVDSIPGFKEDMLRLLQEVSS